MTKKIIDFDNGIFFFTGSWQRRAKSVRTKLLRKRSLAPVMENITTKIVIKKINCD